MIKNLKNDGAEYTFNINWNKYNIEVETFYDVGNTIDFYTTTIQIQNKRKYFDYENYEEFSLRIDKNSIRYDNNLITFESDKDDGDELLIKNLHVECTFPIKETFDDVFKIATEPSESTTPPYDNSKESAQKTTTEPPESTTSALDDNAKELAQNTTTEPSETTSFSVDDNANELDQKTTSEPSESTSLSLDDNPKETVKTTTTEPSESTSSLLDDNANELNQKTTSEPSETTKSSLVDNIKFSTDGTFNMSAQSVNTEYNKSVLRTKILVCFLVICLMVLIFGFLRRYSSEFSKLRDFFYGTNQRQIQA